MGETYAKTGVSIALGDQANVTAFGLLLMSSNEFTDLIGGLVALDVDLSHLRQPRFGIAVDGAGTKLKYTFVSGQHRMIGIDLVAMCVNDLVRYNLTPLGFGMYYATGRIRLETHFEVVSGVAEGCQLAECVYLSGETAEMPGIYHKGEYDIAGFAFGVVDREKRITGESISEGDVVFGIASSGLHANGFSLVRKLFPPKEVAHDQEFLSEILKPTTIYVKPILELNAHQRIKGWAHITGSGLVGKLSRIIPKGLYAEVILGSWSVPEIFSRIAERGKVSEQEMFRTFNMGVGMIGIAARSTAYRAVAFLNNLGYSSWVIGTIRKREGDDKVILI